MSEPGASGIIATMRHVRQAQLCGPGLTAWWKAYPREQLRSFCRQGVAVEWLEAQGDAFALKVAAQARADVEVTDGR